MNGGDKRPRDGSSIKQKSKELTGDDLMFVFGVFHSPVHASGGGRNLLRRLNEQKAKEQLL
jgi:hypothetical protein